MVKFTFTLKICKIHIHSSSQTRPNSHTCHSSAVFPDRSRHDTYISAIEVMRFGLQHCPYTVGVFEFDKSKPSRLICWFVLHDDTIYHLPVLWEVVPQRFWGAESNSHITAMAFNSMGQQYWILSNAVHNSPQLLQLSTLINTTLINTLRY